MRKSTQRLLSVLLSVMIVFGTLPITALANDEPQKAEDGSYLLTTA